MVRKLAAIALGLGLSSTCPAQAPRLAVMDLRAGEGITATQARTLTGMLRTALHGTQCFTLINREDMEEIAKNYEIELVFCDDDACLLRVGNLLGAERLVAGEVGLLLGEFVINARLVDISSDALVNERVATQRSGPSADALEQAMGALAETLAGRPLPPRRFPDEEGRAHYDGAIYAREGDRLLIDRGRNDGVRRGLLYDVFGPLTETGRDSLTGPESDGERRMGQIEVRDVRPTHSVARWRGPVPPDMGPASYPIRRVWGLGRVLFEPCSEFYVAQKRVSINFTVPVYSGSQLIRTVRNTTRVELSGPSFGAALLFAPSQRLAFGVRADAIADDVIRQSYAESPVSPKSLRDVPEELAYVSPVEHMYRISAVARLRLRTTRKVSVDLEADAGRVFWDLGFLEDLGMQPPWYISDLRLRLRYHLFRHGSICLSQGFCASLGGDWQVSSHSSGVGLTFDF